MDAITKRLKASSKIRVIVIDLTLARRMGQVGGSGQVVVSTSGIEEVREGASVVVEAIVVVVAGSGVVVSRVGLVIAGEDRGAAGSTPTLRNCSRPPPSPSCCGG